MKLCKNHLDEMQEMKLLKIEHVGCWLAFWGLTISIMLQTALGEYQFRQVMGESIILLVLSIYLLIACIKNGIWDRRLQPTKKTNLYLSLGTGGIVGAFWFVTSYYRYHMLFASLMTFVFMFIFCSLLVMICLSITSLIYKKRKQHMDALVDQEENEDA